MCECVRLTPAFLSSVFKKELDKDIAGDTSGDFAKLLLALVQVASMLAAHSLMTPGRSSNASFDSICAHVSVSDQTRRTLKRDRLRDDRQGRQSESKQPENPFLSRDQLTNPTNPLSVCTKPV